MEDNKALRHLSFGRTPREWEEAMQTVLDARDHSLLRQHLELLQRELDAQGKHLRGLEDAPLLDRLIEQGRRIFQAERTEVEELETEQSQERSLWRQFRERYRDTFVPPRLKPFLKSSSVFVHPSQEGVQYPGFDKFMGWRSGSQGEIVTLFLRTSEIPEKPESVPPNFFSTYDRKRASFVIERAFRTDLPKGAGGACLVEQIQTLVLDAGNALKTLRWERIQNTPTIAAYVHQGEEGAVLVDGNVGVDATPLGKVGQKILAALGYRVVTIRPKLDAFGFLDLELQGIKASA